MRRMLLVALLLPLAVAQASDGQLFYVHVSTDAAPAGSARFTIASSDRPHQLVYSEEASGAAEFRVRTRDAIILTRVAEGPGATRVIEPLELDAGQYFFDVDLSRGNGTADASAFDLVAADALPWPGSMFYMGTPSAVDLDLREETVFRVTAENASHLHEFRWGANGTGTLTWMILTEDGTGSGVELLRRSATNPHRGEIEEWRAPEAGLYRAVLVYDSFTGAAESALYDLEIEAPPAPETGPDEPAGGPGIDYARSTPATPATPTPTAFASPASGGSPTGTTAATPSPPQSAPHARTSSWFGSASAVVVAAGIVALALRRR